MSSSDHHKVVRAGAAQLAPTSNLTILHIPLPTTLSPFSAVGAPFGPLICQPSWFCHLPTNERPSWTMYIGSCLMAAITWLVPCACRDSFPAAVQCMLPVPATSSARGRHSIPLEFRESAFNPRWCTQATKNLQYYSTVLRADFAEIFLQYHNSIPLLRFRIKATGCDIDPSHPVRVAISHVHLGAG